MTSSETGGSRARLTAVAVMVAVALAGGAAGVVLDRTVLIPQSTPKVARDTTPNTDRLGRTPNPDMRRRFSERMAKDLNLTPEQSAQIDVIMKHQFDEMRKASELVRPTIDSLSRYAQAAMDSLLTPEQRAKVKEMRQRGRERGGRDGGRGGRGGRDGHDGAGRDSGSRSPGR